MKWNAVFLQYLTVGPCVEDVKSRVLPPLAGCEDLSSADPGRVGTRTEPVPGPVLRVPSGPK